MTEPQNDYVANDDRVSFMTSDELVRQKRKISHRKTTLPEF